MHSVVRIIAICVRAKSNYECETRQHLRRPSPRIKRLARLRGQAIEIVVRKFFSKTYKTNGILSVAAKMSDRIHAWTAR